MDTSLFVLIFSTQRFLVLGLWVEEIFVRVSQDNFISVSTQTHKCEFFGVRGALDAMRVLRSQSAVVQKHASTKLALEFSISKLKTRIIMRVFSFEIENSNASFVDACFWTTALWLLKTRIASSAPRTPKNSHLWVCVDTLIKLSWDTLTNISSTHNPNTRNLWVEKINTNREVSISSELVRSNEWKVIGCHRGGASQKLIWGDHVSQVSSSCV